MCEMIKPGKGLPPKPTFFHPLLVPPTPTPRSLNFLPSQTHRRASQCPPPTPRLVSEAGWPIIVGSHPGHAGSLPACLGSTHQLSTATFLFCFVFYFFSAMLSVRCCSGVSLAAEGRVHSPVVVCGPLTVVAPLVSEHRLRSCSWRALEHRPSSSGARPQLLHGLWDFPGPGTEPVSPALAGRFFTTQPPGKSDPLPCNHDIKKSPDNCPMSPGRQNWPQL